MTVTVFTNIGKIVSGDIHHPVLEGDTVIVEDGIITSIGSAEIAGNAKVDEWINVQEATITPGLIDSHTHPVLGDYTPRQESFSYLEGMVHGGVTSIISAGEVHTPGRPTDPAGVKALAVLTHKSFKRFRPKGLKIHAGALILEKGLEKEDFEDVVREGVWLIGEVGLGSIKEAHEAAPMVEWAKELGMKVAMHTGGVSIPGSSIVTAEMVMEVSPTVSSHTNGGPTAITIKEIDKLIDHSDIPLEIVQCGNMKAADYIAKKLCKKGELERLIIGTDAPSGTGVLPLGILRTITQISALSNIPANKVLACATGNTANKFGLNTSKIAIGKEADLVVMDAPIGSSGKDALSAIECGDIPAVTLVMIDGKVRIEKSRNTPPAHRQPIYHANEKVFIKKS